MRKIIVLVALAALAGCHAKKEEQKVAPTAKHEASTKKVSYDPAFTAVAGRWKSAPAASGLPAGEYLQIDIASAGDFTMEVRRQNASSVEVLESVRGSSKKSADGLDATLKEAPKGPVIKAIGNWHGGLAGDGKARSMALKGANGQTYNLTWDQM